MPTSTPAGLDPSDEYFWEHLTAGLVTGGLIPEFNLTLAQKWYKRALLEHAVRERFPGRNITIQWFESPRFSYRTWIIYKNCDPFTPAEILICDGEVNYEAPWGGPEPGEYAGIVEITDATFCIHWLPKYGNITALLSHGCSPEMLDQQITSVL